MPNDLFWTRDDVRNLFADHHFGLVAEDRPEKFTHMRVESPGGGGGALEIESAGWTDRSGILNIKWTHVQGKLLNIATLMCYPTGSPELLPIFAAEWVVTGNRCHALILDVETAGDQPQLIADLSPLLQPLHTHYAGHFPVRDDTPQWFREIAQPWSFFSHGPLDALTVMRQAYNDYLRVVMDGFYLPRRNQAQGGADHPLVSAYKRHHYENSPGFPLFSAKLGADHAKEFLRDWHFGPPRYHRNAHPEPVRMANEAHEVVARR